MANPGEFTLRAFLNKKLDLTQAEAVADALCMDVEGVVGGDRDGLDLVRTAAEEAHLGEPEVGA